MKGQFMNRALGIALLAVGIVLLIFGINSTESFVSDVSRFFTGSPTDKAIWLLLGGIGAIVAGAVMSLRGPGKI
jgi:uncharacterized membrane protein YidH (DUF202 family)